MERVASNYDFSMIEKIMFNMEDNHTSSNLSKLKNELNKFFIKAKCKEVLYTVNTDKLFFGMRVYPVFDGEKAMEILGDKKSVPFEEYYVEFDSKLFDPMLGLNKREKTAILLHEIGHIVYDTSTIDEVRSQIDMYFAKSGDYVDINASKGYKELIGYALKDSIVKIGSLFTKVGNTETVADTFVVSCGYGPDLESAMRKIVRSSTYMAKNVDDRFIALSWVLRLRNEEDYPIFYGLKLVNEYFNKEEIIEILNSSHNNWLLSNIDKYVYKSKAKGTYNKLKQISKVYRKALKSKDINKPLEVAAEISNLYLEFVNYSTAGLIYVNKKQSNQLYDLNIKNKDKKQ